MSSATVRRSVTLPLTVARRVKQLAQAGRTSASRTLVNLIEAGLAVKERERAEFFATADQLAPSIESARAGSIEGDPRQAHIWRLMPRI